MEKPIRVLHILQRMEAGGTQALLMNIYKKIDKSKVQFDFLVEYPNKEFYDDEITKLGGKIYYSSVRVDFNIIKFQKKIDKILKENNYKIVHVHAFTIGFFCLKVAKKNNVPIRIAHSHNNETLHDFKYIFKRCLQKMYPIYATNLFACSEEAGKYLFGNKNFMVLNNAIDSNKFKFDSNVRNDIRKKMGLENSFVVGHVGRFHPQKNHNFLIEIFKKIKEIKENAKLILIGSGDFENDIHKKVSDLHLENDVIFLGNRKDMEILYQVMDIFIFPSLFEGLGIVTIEAQASGLPVLCSDALPTEVEILPICKKLSLKEDCSIWAKEAISLINSSNLRENTTKEIIDAGFDLSVVALNLEKFYLDSYEKIKY